MSEDVDKAVSKVLIYDCSRIHETQVKDFCVGHNLTPVKPRTNKVLEVLLSNVDLGAVFISEDIPGYPGAGVVMGQQIHRYRPELPIFLRVESELDVAKYANSVFCATYTGDTITNIVPTIDKHVFCNSYPNSFLRAIDEISRRTLGFFFENVSVTVSTPCLVKDRLLYGEIMSLLPVESEWCKGYLMVQSESSDFVGCIKKNKFSKDPSNDQYICDDVLSELTNMLWGGVKQRFVAQASSATNSLIQVPIIVNHQNNYISFGSKAPLLSITYNLTKADGSSFKLYVMFIFNLHWDASWFAKHTSDTQSLKASGELIFF